MDKSKGKASGNFNGFTFINHRLVAADKEWLAAANLPEEFPLFLVLHLVETGYKFSMSFDSKNQSYVASITDRDESGAFNKHTLSGRGASPIDSWYSLAYRHFRLADEDWSFFSVSGNDEGGQFG